MSKMWPKLCHTFTLSWPNVWLVCVIQNVGQIFHTNCVCFFSNMWPTFLSVEQKQTKLGPFNISSQPPVPTLWVSFFWNNDGIENWNIWSTSGPVLTKHTCATHVGYLLWNVCQIPVVPARTGKRLTFCTWNVSDVHMSLSNLDYTQNVGHIFVALLWPRDVSCLYFYT